MTWPFARKALHTASFSLHYLSICEARHNSGISCEQSSRRLKSLLLITSFEWVLPAPPHAQPAQDYSNGYYSLWSTYIRVILSWLRRAPPLDRDIDFRNGWAIMEVGDLLKWLVMMEAFVQQWNADGWRCHNDVCALTCFAKIKYKIFSISWQ